LKYDPKQTPIMLANPNYDTANLQPVLVASDQRDNNKCSTDLAQLIIATYLINSIAKLMISFLLTISANCSAS
jgi:hypothetical protein